MQFIEDWNKDSGRSPGPGSGSPRYQEMLCMLQGYQLQQGTLNFFQDSVELKVKLLRRKEQSIDNIYTTTLKKLPNIINYAGIGGIIADRRL